MQRRTSTQKINETIKNNLLILERVEICNKDLQKIEILPNEKFIEYFDFLCKSGIFMDAIGWHFERNHKTDNYEIECCRMNGDVDIIVTVYLRKNDNTTDEKIEKALLFEESED